MKDWKEHMIAHRAEQCLVGTEFSLNLMKEINASVYVEVGCGHLATFAAYQAHLPTSGLAIGIDIRDYDPWNGYMADSSFRLIKGSFRDEGFTLKQVHEALDGKLIDFLFIDGDHSIEGVQADWDALSPLVRKGGIVQLHDWDDIAVARGDLIGQGAAVLTNKLKDQGYTINIIPRTRVGTAYIRIE